MLLLRKIGTRKGQMTFNFDKQNARERKTVTFFSIGLGSAGMFDAGNKRNQKHLIDVLRNSGVISQKAKVTDAEKTAIIDFARQTQAEIFRLNSTNGVQNESIITLKLPTTGARVGLNFRLRLGKNGRVYILPYREKPKVLHSTIK